MSTASERLSHILDFIRSKTATTRPVWTNEGRKLGVAGIRVGPSDISELIQKGHQQFEISRSFPTGDTTRELYGLSLIVTGRIVGLTLNEVRKITHTAIRITRRTESDIEVGILQSRSVTLSPRKHLEITTAQTHLPPTPLTPLAREVGSALGRESLRTEPIPIGLDSQDLIVMDQSGRQITPNSKTDKLLANIGSNLLGLKRRF